VTPNIFKNSSVIRYDLRIFTRIFSAGKKHRPEKNNVLIYKRVYGKQNKTKQNKTKQNKTKQNKTKQNKKHRQLTVK